MKKIWTMSTKSGYTFEDFDNQYGITTGEFNDVELGDYIEIKTFISGYIRDFIYIIVGIDNRYAKPPASGSYSGIIDQLASKHHLAIMPALYMSTYSPYYYSNMTEADSYTCKGYCSTYSSAMSGSPLQSVDYYGSTAVMVGISQDHILSHKIYPTKNGTTAINSNFGCGKTGATTDIDYSIEVKAALPTEVELTGHDTYSSSAYDNWYTEILPLFKIIPWWWCFGKLKYIYNIHEYKVGGLWTRSYSYGRYFLFGNYHSGIISIKSPSYYQNTEVCGIHPIMYIG